MIADKTAPFLLWHQTPKNAPKNTPQIHHALEKVSKHADFSSIAKANPRKIPEFRG
jgi:hypothetical protein